MNEALFFLQVLLIIAFAFGALKLGKAALTSWIALQAVIANLFVLKQIPLFGFDVTASDAFAIGSLLGLNLLQENFEKKDSEKATWICFSFMIFFTLFAQIHLLFKPSVFDTTHSAFSTILSHSPRLMMASLGVFFVVQQIDLRFFSYLRRRMPTASFALRSGIALLLSQFLDTVLFSYTGLYGLVFSVVDIILLSFAIKLIVIFSFTTIFKWIKT